MATAREYAVRSVSQPGQTYRVLLGIDGEAVCTCAGYEFRRTCRHINEIREIHMTEETQALVPITVEPPRSLLPTRDELSVIGLLARTVVGARGHAVPKDIDSPAKAAAVMLAGHELGVKPMTALRHILVVNGRTEPDAQLMLGIVQAREPDARVTVVRLTERECTVRITRPTRGVDAEYTYSIDDAKRAGLIKQGGNWEKFPKDMLRWAATKRICRAYAADLINSVGAIEVGMADAMMQSLPAEDPLEGEFTTPAQIPESALYNPGDDPASGLDAVDPETGEAPMSAAEIAAAEAAVEAADFREVDAAESVAGAPIGQERIDAAARWLDEAAAAAKCSRTDVLEALNADLVQVAMDLGGMRERWAAMRPAGAAEPAPRANAPATSQVKSRPHLIAWAKQACGLDRDELLARLNLTEIADLDEIAREEGGWPAAAEFVRSIVVPEAVQA